MSDEMLCTQLFDGVAHNQTKTAPHCWSSDSRFLFPILALTFSMLLSLTWTARSNEQKYSNEAFLSLPTNLRHLDELVSIHLSIVFCTTPRVACNIFTRTLFAIRFVSFTRVPAKRFIVWTLQCCYSMTTMHFAHLWCRLQPTFTTSESTVGRYRRRDAWFACTSTTGGKKLRAVWISHKVPVRAVSREIKPHEILNNSILFFFPWVE